MTDAARGGLDMVERLFTRDDLRRMTVDDFLEMSPADRRSAIIAQVLATQDCTFGSSTAWAWFRSARVSHRWLPFRRLLLELLRSDDPRLHTGTIKEQLLCFLREFLETNSPVLDQLFDIFQTEPHQKTRMRIIRAIGKTGGSRATSIMKKVVEQESQHDTHAAREAARWLSGDGAAVHGARLFAPGLVSPAGR